MRSSLLVALGLLPVVFACSSAPDETPAAPSASTQAAADGAPAAAEPTAAETASAPQECTTDAECRGRGPASFCSKPVCDGGRCVQKILQPAGTKLVSQRQGDCTARVCGADGSVIDTYDDKDTFDDGNECTEDLCKGGAPLHVVKMEGSLCTFGICSKQGACVQCAPGIQSCTRAGDICIDGFCAGALCANTQKDPGEGDIDCGGKCPKCGVGKNCSSGLQCESGVCTAGKCANPTCTDGVKNGTESEQDCGGPSCAPCADTARCRLPSDCQSGVCIEAVCYPPTCTDGVKNGTETGVDCGGSCEACP